MQRLIEVRIEKLSLGGSGLARHKGQVVFVPFSAPGDLLKVEITEQKKNFSEAKIVELLEPSPSRVAPPCPVFRRCGGCSYQHISYEEQLRQKQMIVDEQLSKFLRTKVTTLPIVGSPKQFFYRNRVQLKRFGSQLGFFARESHDIVDIEKCYISEESLNQEILKIRHSPPSTELQNISLGPEGDGFSQINSLQNEKLIETVLLWAQGETNKETYSEIYDLYAGAGNFSFPLFNAFPKSPLSAVELTQNSVLMAQKKLDTLNMSPKKFRFLLSDVEYFLKKMTIAPSSLILMDPPRTGCDEKVIRGLAYQPFKKLLYISCNPSTLGRDLSRLFEFSPRKLRLGRVQAFDMFPQTDHIEVLTELVLVDS